MLSHARWTATSDDEQAVSMASAGPLRLRKYEMRAARIALDVPMNAAPTVSWPSRFSTRA